MNTFKPKWPPEVTVAAIITRDNKFLLVEEESDGRIVYNQPAGHLEPNETVTAAVLRETLEETGWEFTPQALVGIYFYTSPFNGITYQRICFSGEIREKNPSSKLDSSIIQTLWLSREELIKQTEKLRSPLVLKCIDDYLNNHRYPLQLITDLRL